MWDIEWLRDFARSSPADPMGAPIRGSFVSSAQGHIDKIADGCLYGWVWSSTNPNVRHSVDAFVDQVYIGQYRADIYRDDLKAAGIGDGRYGFVAPIPDPLTDANLSHCVATTSFPETVRLRHPTNVTPAPWISKNRTKRAQFGYIREMFGALAQQYVVANETAVSWSNEPKLRTKNRLLDTLVGRSQIRSPKPLHGHYLSAFADHVRHKYGMNEIYDTTFAVSEFDSYWVRYLETGGFEGNSIVPLSADDIAYLNAPVPLGDGTKNTTRATFLFAREYLGICLPGRAASESEYENLIYWWVVDRSRRLHVEDCLVTSDQLRLMQSVDAKSSEEYPLSKFMKLFVARNVVLRQLQINSSRDRRLIYGALVLYALRNPLILDLMPQAWLAKIIDQVQARAAFVKTSMLHDFGPICVAAIERRLNSHLRKQPKGNCGFLSDEGHRVASAQLTKPHGPVVDVQIIGPFHRALGLGQSCRRLANLIGGLGYKINLFDVDLKNDSPQDCFDAAGFGQLSNARVNILHLNAERIPNEIAYLPDIFSDAFNIGVCYWELPTPAECQLLGLSLPDEIWLASSYMAEAARPFAKSVVNIGMPYELTAPANRDRTRANLAQYGVKKSDFVFLTVSDALSWVQRKNPVGAIRAFVDAFRGDENVKLIVKTRNADHVHSPDQKKIWAAIIEISSEYPQVIFINQTFTYQQHQQLVATSDCLVSLHRAEGFGLDILHAALSGVPVIATAFSGNMDFCEPHSMWLIPYARTFLRSADYSFVKPGDTWADPDIEAAAAAMKDVYLSPAKRLKMADRARHYVERNFSPEAISRRIDLRLKEILSSR